MKKIIVLFTVLAFTTIGSAQSPMELGDNCFEKGNYKCAKINYQESINTSSGMDKQIAEIKYRRAESCDEWLTSADRYFNEENYYDAKEKYQLVLNENPEDSYAAAQIEKCESAIEAAITLSVSKENLTLSSFGGTQRIIVNTNAETYTVSQSPAWCTVQKYSDYFDVTYEANTSKTDRTAEFKVTAGKKEVNVSVIQPPKPKKEITLSVSKENVAIGSKTTIVFIDVVTNASDYQIINLPSWCKIKGKYDTWFNLDIDENSSSDSRSDWLTISAGEKSVKVYIEQSGTKSSIEQSPITNRNRFSSSSYRFFALGYEGGQIAKYGFRMEFGGRKFVGMFLNVRSTLISDQELLDIGGYLENKNEVVLGLNFRISRVVYFNLGGGYGYYRIPETNETLEQIEYYPAYGGFTIRLGKRINFSVGASFMDIEQAIDSNVFDPEITLGLTINLYK